MSWLDKWENATHATKAGVVATQRISLDDTDVASFVADHPNESQSQRRHWIVKKYRSYLENHRNGEENKNAKGHYHAGFACGCFAWREILGGLIAGDFIDELQTVFYDSFDSALGDRVPPGDEFAKIARGSLKAVLIELAEYNPDNPNDPDDPDIQKYLRDRANRNFGYRHDDPMNTAPDLDDSAFSMNGHKPNSTTESKTEMSSQQTEEVSSDSGTKDRRDKPLDLRRLRTEPRKPPQWFEVGLLPRGGYISLASEAGYGKSVLGRAIAVDNSLGHSHLDPNHTFEAAKVIYLDFENGEDWWADGLGAMNAPLDIPNLAVMCYPDIGALDTRQGGKKFLKLIRDLADDLDGLDVLMIDTVSRVVVGNENDADTWSKFYQYSMLPLRRDGIAINRMDHLGKDPDKGPRGSSHKLSDVDADFRLTAAFKGSDDLTLTLGKRRRQHFTPSMSMKRLDDPLRHEPVLQLLDMRLRNNNGIVKPLNPDVAALVTDLDALGVSTKLGRDKAQADYKQRGGVLVARNEVWSAAIKFRRDTAKQNGQQTSAQNGQQT